MKNSPLKIGLLAAAVFAVLAMTSCTYDPYGTAYASYTYTNYPYGYTTSYLPYGYTSVYIGGTRYWHCNNHYYRHYPGRGYVVVKRPHGHHKYHGGGRYGHRYPQKPVQYAHHRGDRHQYGHSSGDRFRSMSRTNYPSRAQNRSYPSRYNMVQTGPSSRRMGNTRGVLSNPGLSNPRMGNPRMGSNPRMGNQSMSSPRMSNPRMGASSPRMQPTPVQPRPAPSMSRQNKSRATNQSPMWNSGGSGGGSIHRNPSPPPTRSAPMRSAPTRSSMSSRRTKS